MVVPKSMLVNRCRERPKVSTLKEPSRREGLNGARTKTRLPPNAIPFVYQRCRCARSVRTGADRSRTDGTQCGCRPTAGEVPAEHLLDTEHESRECRRQHTSHR